jgi:2-dehydro-3-deoxygalactonokinase
LTVALIAIDWGTSAARAYRLDTRGGILDERSGPFGVQKIEPGKFADALATLVGSDVPSDVPMIACGMIGSRQGWVEAPYRVCPAGFDAIVTALTPVPGTPLRIVPGLICRDLGDAPDVMRGEETQILGAIDDQVRKAATRIVVLPGTHSKWALIQGESIEGFATFMTGELYAVLLEHSILGRLATSGSHDDVSFERGARTSLREAAALTHDLFSARTLPLTGVLAPEGVGDYLSGLLLGAEIGAAQRWLRRRTVRGDSVILIGEAALCERYRRALAFAGIEATMGPAEAAARGLWRIARHSGMVQS